TDSRSSLPTAELFARSNPIGACSSAAPTFPMMSPWLNDFLRNRLPLPRVAAWGARLSDVTVIGPSYQQSLPEQRIKHTVARLSNGADALLEHGIQPLGPLWIFELATIPIGLRPDGNCLVLFLESAPASAQLAIQSLLEDFLQLSAHETVTNHG